MVDVYMGHRLNTFLTMVKQIGKELSHSWDSRQEHVATHYSPESSNKIGLSLMVLCTPDCNNHPCLMSVSLSSW